MILKNKKAEFDFVWLFAIIAGAAILVLAVYGATKGADTLRYQQETQLAKSLAVVLGPLQAGLSDSSTNQLSFNQDTRITNACSDIGFGSNQMTTATKSGIGKDWAAQRGEITINNLYIFSSNQEGKRFEITSKPFNYPFKVADLLFISSDKYCLQKVPKDIEKEMKNVANFQTENCTDDMKTICFGTSGCDINIYGTCSAGCDTKYDEGYVEKNGDRFYFVGSLLYGAIFAEKNLYDCNVNRLIYRAKQVSEILADKAKLMDSKGCSTAMQTDLVYWASVLNKTVPDSIIDKNDIAKSINEKASNERCKSW